MFNVKDGKWVPGFRVGRPDGPLDTDVRHSLGRNFLGSPSMSEPLAFTIPFQPGTGLPWPGDNPDGGIQPARKPVKCSGPNSKCSLPLKIRANGIFRDPKYPQFLLCMPCYVSAYGRRPSRGYVTDLNLSTLFEHWDHYSTYASLDDELQAIAAGSKAMSYFSFPDEDIDASDLSVEVRRIALELNLVTIRRKGLVPELEGPVPHTYVFIIRDDEEAWRIPAFLFAMKVALRSGWSDAVDDVMAHLLGYSDAEIQRWNADRKKFHVNEEGLTVLFLMSATQAENVRMLGRRAIDPKAIRPPVTAFYNLHGKVVRKDASTLVPVNHELLRAAVHRTFAKVIFSADLIEDPAIEIATCTIDETEGAALNSALRSNFQFLGADGWR